MQNQRIHVSALFLQTSLLGKNRERVREPIQSPDVGEMNWPDKMKKS